MSAPAPASATPGTTFERFVRDHQDLVFATAVRLLGNAADAEDVAQAVFLKAFERFSTLDGNPSAPGWLRTVARNLSLNHLSRYRSRWRLFSELLGIEGDDRDAAPFDPAADTGTPGELLEARERHEQLEQALRALPDAQRVPLVLFHFEGASYQEIAGLLGISLAKVKTDIHRGRDALRRYLTDDRAR